MHLVRTKQVLWMSGEMIPDPKCFLAFLCVTSPTIIRDEELIYMLRITELRLFHMDSNWRSLVVLLA